MVSGNIEHGNFTSLAADYRHRPGYSQHLLEAISRWNKQPTNELDVVDVGAGTGKLTKHLVDLGFRSFVAVEPNEAMRNVGVSETKGMNVRWFEGAGEATGLPSASADWLLMGSSFHWVKLEEGLTEFHRVLRSDGMFTAVWNPRDLQRSPLQAKIDTKVKEMIPGLKRVSSGGSSTQDWLNLLVSTGQFRNALFLEARHEEVMSPERYMGVWQSVNDIQVQAGPDRWQEILQMIENEIVGMNEIVVPYTTRSWTVWRADEVNQ